MKLVSHARSDAGTTRTRNEDYFLTAPELGLYIVCDGLAVEAGGDIASRTAAAVIQQQVAENFSQVQSFTDTPEGRAKVTRLVNEAIQIACRAIYAQSGTEKHSRSATTMSLLLFLGQKALLAHVGDTRVYLKRGHRIDQLTEDHTYRTEMMKKGVLSAEQMRGHQFGAVVTRALGQQEVTPVDTLYLDVLSGDTFVLCTDGLSRYLERPVDLRGFLTDADPANTTASLVNFANDRGGRDNVTAIVIRVESDEGDRLSETDRSVSIDMMFGALRGLPLFQYLDSREIMQLVQISKVRTLEPGDVAYSEAQRDDSLYITLDGRLSLWRAGTKIAELQRGTSFGETALLSARPRMTTVKAEEPSKVLLIPRTSLFELLRSQPELGVRVLFSLGRGLSERLDAASLQLAAEHLPVPAPIFSDLPFTLSS